MGRLTLNPLKHIDPIGTLLIPIAMYIATGGKFLFGYAKPVPFDPDNLRNPRRDLIWVSLSAPVTSFVMGLFWAVLLVVLAALGVQEPFFIKMAQGGVLVNLVMWAFNLFPLPPLDGGRILVGILPDGAVRNFLLRLEPYGFYIVMGLVLIGVVGKYWMSPLIAIGYSILQTLIGPLISLLGS